MNYEVFTDALNRFGKDFALRIAHTSGEIVGPFDSILVGRLLVVLLLCGLIGWERSLHERASGFRPHILVGLGACLMTMAGAYALPDMGARDPMRVASYVVSGIGFLGAGAILRHGSTVRGLTTAASIWGVAGIGIAVGVGMAGLATATTTKICWSISMNLKGRIQKLPNVGLVADGVEAQARSPFRSKRHLHPWALRNVLQIVL